MYEFFIYPILEVPLGLDARASTVPAFPCFPCDVEPIFLGNGKCY